MFSDSDTKSFKTCLGAFRTANDFIVMVLGCTSARMPQRLCLRDRHTLEANVSKIWRGGVEVPPSPGMPSSPRVPLLPCVPPRGDQAEKENQVRSQSNGCTARPCVMTFLLGDTNRSLSCVRFYGKRGDLRLDYTNRQTSFSCERSHRLREVGTSLSRHLVFQGWCIPKNLRVRCVRRSKEFQQATVAQARSATPRGGGGGPGAAHESLARPA